MHILFVEDHAPFAQTALATYLSEHDVVWVLTVAHALSALDQVSFDAAIVDYDLPDGKGDMVVRALRLRQPECVVVAASAHDSGNEALIDAGAQEVCAKEDFEHIQDVLP